MKKRLFLWFARSDKNQQSVKRGRGREGFVSEADKRELKRIRRKQDNYPGPPKLDDIARKDKVVEEKHGNKPFVGGKENYKGKELTAVDTPGMLQDIEAGDC